MTEQHASQPKRTTPAHDAWDEQEVAALGISDEQWERMQQVERIFRNAPMVDAPPDFASKVMLTIAAKQFDDMNKPQSGGSSGGGNKPSKPQGGRKLLFFMSMAGTLTTAMVALTVALQGGLLNAMLRQLALWYNDVTQPVASLWQSLTPVAPSDVLLTTLLMSAVALVVAWARVMHYVASRRQRVVYHIPIKFD
jgi:hypothetical protein